MVDVFLDTLRKSILENSGIWLQPTKQCFSRVLKWANWHHNHTFCTYYTLQKSFRKFKNQKRCRKTFSTLISGNTPPNMVEIRPYSKAMIRVYGIWVSPGKQYFSSTYCKRCRVILFYSSNIMYGVWWLMVNSIDNVATPLQRWNFGKILLFDIKCEWDRVILSRSPHILNLMKKNNEKRCPTGTNKLFSVFQLDFTMGNSNKEDKFVEGR